MTDKKIEVSLEAKTAGLKSGMSEASSKVQQASQQMQAAIQAANSQTQTSLSQMMSSFTKFRETASSSMIGATEAVHSGIGGASAGVGLLGEKFAKLQEVFLGFAAVMGGGKVFKEAVTATKEFYGEAAKLQRVLGSDSNEAAALAIALGDVYSSSEVYESALQKLTKQINTNEEGVKKMGVATRDANGHLLSSSQLMTNALAVVNNYKQGSDRSVATMQLFGARAQDLGTLLNLNNEVLDEARKKQEALGLTITVHGKEAMAQYKAAMNDVDDVMLAFKKTVGEAVIPVLTQMGKEFAETGPEQIGVLGASIRAVMNIFMTFRSAVTQVAIAVSAALGAMQDMGQGFAEFWVKIMHGDFSGAMDVAKRNVHILSDDAKRTFKEMQAEAEKTGKAMMDLWKKDNSGAAPAGKSGTKTYGETGSSNKSRSRMSEWETELAELKTHLAEEANARGQAVRFTEQQEIDFWNKIKEGNKLSSDESLSIRKREAELKQTILKNEFDAQIASFAEQEAAARNNAEKKVELARQSTEKVKSYYGEGSKEYEKALKQLEQIQKEADKQQLDLAKVHAEQVQAVKLAQVTNDQEIAQLAYDMGNATNEQLLAQQQNFEDRIYAIKLQALKEQAELVDPQADPVKKAQLDAQIEELEIQHQAKLQQIKNKQVLNSKSKDSLSDVGREIGASTGLTSGGDMGASVFSSLSSAMDNMATRTKSFKQNMNDTFKSIGTTFIQYLVVNPLKQYVAMLVQMLAKKLGFTAANKSLETTSSATTVATKATEATAVVGANAAEAASGAAASVTAIPWIGWAMAGGVFATTLALVMGAKSSIASASGGYDIGAGVNPLTQLHEQEMVLPSSIANPLRENLASGGGLGGGTTVNYHDNSGRLTKAAIRENARTIAEVLNETYKGGYKGQGA